MKKHKEHPWKVYFYLIKRQYNHRLWPFVTMLSCSRLLSIISTITWAWQFSEIIKVINKETDGKKVLIQLVLVELVQALISMLKSFSDRYIEKEKKMEAILAEDILDDAFLSGDFEEITDFKHTASLTDILYNESWGKYNLSESRNMLEEFIGSIFSLAFGFFATRDFFVQDFWGLENTIEIYFCNIFLFSLLSFVTLFLFDRIKRTFFEAKRKYLDKLSADSGNYCNVEDIVGQTKNASDIRIYSLWEKISVKWSSQNSFMLNSEMHKDAKGKVGFFSAIAEAVKEGILPLFCIWAGIGAAQGIIEYEDIVKYVSAMMILYSGVDSMVSFYISLIESKPYFKMIYEYIHKQMSKKKEFSIPCSLETIKSIEFVDVSYKYSNSERMAIDHLSVKISVPEKISVVGENGAGKTTFVKLLCGILKPSSGLILVDGYDIQNLRKEDYLKYVTAVFQNFVIYPYRIGENITMRCDYDLFDLKNKLDEFGQLSNFPKKYIDNDLFLFRTLNNDGIEISEGEQQKIALSRAMYKENTPILILDEPTASLDPVSENDVYTGVAERASDKMIVFISHRMSSCVFSNRVLVFEKGRIVRDGEHKDLIKEVNGVYYRLWSAQADLYRDKD